MNAPLHAAEAADVDRTGLGRHWVRVPRTPIYLGPWLLALVLSLWLVAYLLTGLLYTLATIYEDTPLRQPTVLDGATGVAVFLGLLVLHEAAHAAAVVVLGGRVVRFGVGGGGAHVVYADLDHRPRAQALVALAGPTASFLAALTVFLGAGGPQWTTGYAAVYGMAALGAVEALAQLVPFRGRRRRSDGWVALSRWRAASKHTPVS